MNRMVALACLTALSLEARAQVMTADSNARAQYDLTIEIGMPHLDENLRYATTRELRCLNTKDLARAFPILSDVSLQDCSLALSEQRSDSAAYTLQCTGGHGTTGSANWKFDGPTIAGTMNVRLGGKNMTFHQRISGRMVGPCTQL
ncbi:MAG: DUF3617 family protein [Proteobacteria bacterium]|nr:DUF3617 family protein [Pseudomonadota bacterium]